MDSKVCDIIDDCLRKHHLEYDIKEKISRYHQINEALYCFDETFSDIISITLSTRQLHRRFDPGYGRATGMCFTAWTNDRVYFATVYDGSDGVDSVSRNPSNERSMIGVQ